MFKQYSEINAYLKARLSSFILLYGHKHLTKSTTNTSPNRKDYVIEIIYYLLIINKVA